MQTPMRCGKCRMPEYTPVRGSGRERGKRNWSEGEDGEAEGGPQPRVFFVRVANEGLKLDAGHFRVNSRQGIATGEGVDSPDRTGSFDRKFEVERIGKG